MSYGSKPRLGRCLAFTGVVLFACSDPVATSTTVPELQPWLTGAAAPGQLVATVRGGAHFQLKDPPAFVGPFKWVYRFSFNVDGYADGTAAGDVKFNSHVPPGRDDVNFPGDWWGEVAVDCLEVAGNTAWMTGEVVRVRTDSPLGPPLGDVAMFIVRDNGPNAIDEVNVGPVSAFGATDCTDTPPIFPGGFTDGNVSVRTF